MSSIIRRLIDGSLGSRMDEIITTTLGIGSRVDVFLIEDGIERKVKTSHNLWTSFPGRNSVKMGFQVGCSGTTPLLVHSMNLGSTASSTTWTLITNTRVDTVNTPGGTTSVVFTGEWGASGTISNIRQAGIQQYTYSGGGSKMDNPGVGNLCSIVNLGGTFTKADGVSLKIEWTTDVTST